MGNRIATSMLSLTVGGLLTSQPCLAKSAVTLFGSAFYDSQSLDSDLGAAGTTTTTTSSDVAVNIGGGYTFDIGLYLGVKYLQFQNTDKISLSNATAITSPSQTVKTIFGAPGVSIGYVFDKGLYLIGTGLISPDETVETTSINGTTTAYSKSEVKGTYGYMVDLGFTYHLSPAFGLGPQLTYYAASFTKYDSVSSGTTTSGTLKDYKESKVFPFLAMSLSI